MTIQPLPHNLFTKWIQQGIQKGYIQDCIQTINGEAYISTSFIKKQCIQHMDKHKGRMTISYISDMLNIDNNTLNPFLISLSNEQHWTLIDDIILSSDYIDHIKLSCIDIIEKNGFLSLVAQTKYTGLPHRFLQKILDNTNFINLPELSDLYFTTNYIENEKQRIINELQMANQPLTMLKLQRSLNMQDNMFYVFLDQIIKDHIIQGIFRGRRDKTVFIPQIYRNEQLSLIDSLLKAGNYIEYATIEQHYEFSTPKDLLLKQYPDIILLESCAVNEIIVSSLEKKILDNRTWLDVSNHLPFALTTTDVVTLLELTIQRLKKKKKSIASSKTNNNNNNDNDKSATIYTNNNINITDIIVVGKFIMTQEYLQSVIKNAHPFLNKYATLELSKNQKYIHSNKGKRKKNNIDVISLTDEDIIHHLVDDQGLDIELATIVSTKLKRTFMDEIQRAIQSIYTPTLNNDINNNEDDANENKMKVKNDTWMDQQKLNVQSILLELGRKMYFNFKSIQHFEDESTKKSLEKYMVRQWSLDFIFYLVLFHSLYQCKDRNEVMTITGLRSVDIEKPNEVNETHKKDIIAALISSDHELQNELSSLQQAMQTGKKMNEFMKYINSNTRLTQKLSWNGLETETALSHINEQFRKMLQNQLEATNITVKTAPSILHLTVLSYFLMIYQSPLNVTGKYVPQILKNLSPTLLTMEKTTITTITNNNIIIDHKQQNQLLINAQTMILSSSAGKKSTTDSPSPPIDLGLMRQVRDLGLNLCKYKKD